MVVVFIVVGILVLGVVAGLVSRPRYKRAQAAFGTGVRALRERSLLFARDEVAAVFPGPMTQEQLTIATADLLAELTQRMAGR